MTLNEEDRADLLALLGDTLQWRLPETQWSLVEPAIELLDQALDRGGDGAVHRAAVALMLAGPRRVGSGVVDAMDLPEPKPVPERTRDLVNKLLKRLGAPPTGVVTGDEDAGDDDAA